jgi:hypothetical protein
MTRARAILLLHLALVVLVSASWESLFLDQGLNHLDEGWVLYAAMQLHEGRTLYDDAFFVFPPGHVLASYVGYAIDPPGIVAARAVYAAFTIALCVAIYLLGRRLMPARFALLGALLLAIAAPRSHEWQLLFGYRYLAFSAFALLAFARRLDGGDRRWMALAGALAGVALCFRLTPAFAVSAAIGVGLLAAGGGCRRWLGDGATYALALLAVISPVALWLSLSAGLEHAVVEFAVRPFSMLQPLPWPPVEVPDAWSREALTELFVAVQFRLWWLLYAGYAIGLVVLRVRSRERFGHALLVAVVVWGAIFFTRSLGRSDEPHLDSAIPPVCLLVAHLSYLVLRRARAEEPPPSRGRAELAACAAVLLAWAFLLRVDLYLDPGYWARVPLKAAGESVFLQPNLAWIMETRAARIRNGTDPGDTILIMDNVPVYHVLTRRMGPGRSDVIMPGTFRNEQEERAFLALCEEDPPAAVIWEEKPFDGMPERSVERTAPLVAAWVKERYEPVGAGVYRTVWFPRRP